MQYLRALDLRQWGEAREDLQQALFTAPAATPLATELALEAAFFEVAIRRDAERGRWWLERARRSLDRALLQAVQAALAFSVQPSPDRADAPLGATRRLAARSGVDALRAERLGGLASSPPR